MARVVNTLVLLIETIVLVTLGAVQLFCGIESYRMHGRFENGKIMGFVLMLTFGVAPGLIFLAAAVKIWL